MRHFLCALLSVFLCLTPLAHAKEVHTKHYVVRHHDPVVDAGITGTRGLASWYGKHEQGHRMANGERFDRFKFTAASRTLPFGTRIMVTNLVTGLSTIVTITDRGPWVKTRTLDLAEAPAQVIGCRGICRIEYSKLPEVFE